MVNASLTERSSQIYETLEPTRGEELVVLRVAKGSKKGDYKTVLDAWDANMQAQLASKDSFPNRDFRYAANPLQNASDLVHSNTKKGKAFKKLNESYWFHNEPWLTSNAVIPYPIVGEKDGKRIVEGERIAITINKDDAVNNLVRAQIFREPKQGMWKGDVAFENGYASVWSDWDWDPGEWSFRAYAGEPSAAGSGGIVALAKVPFKREVPKQNVRQVDEAEYQELLRDANKYRELRPRHKEILG